MPAIVYYPKFRYTLADGTAAVGYKLYTYVAGTSTPLATYTDNSLSTPNANPTILDANGEMVGFPPDDAVYKLVLKTAADATVWTIDNVTFGGAVLDPVTEWYDSPVTPTYISATSFSVAGNYTSYFPPGQRVRAANNGGTSYSTVVSSTYSAGVTTVVVVNDSTALDAGISNLAYGFLDAALRSIPVFSDIAVSATNTNIPSNSTTVINTGAGAYGDKLSEYASGTGRFTAKVTGNYLVSVNGQLNQNGANVTLGDAFYVKAYKNGSASADLMLFSWPFATGAGSKFVQVSGFAQVQLTAGDYLDLRVVTPTYTTATMIAICSMAVRRLP